MAANYRWINPCIFQASTVLPRVFFFFDLSFDSRGCFLLSKNHSHLAFMTHLLTLSLLLT